MGKRKTGNGSFNCNTASILWESAPLFYERNNVTVSTKIERIAAKASRDAKCIFTSLAHHIDEESLLKSLRSMRRGSSPGVDKLTVEQALNSGTDWCSETIKSIHNRSYKAPPVKRVLIPKPGKSTKRPIGIPTVLDRAVQGATAEVLGKIYEQDFLINSAGGRPKVSAHHAVSSLVRVIYDKKVNWVLEADLKNFFGSLDHEWVLKFMQHRIGDPRILNLIRKWLKAGAIGSGGFDESLEGVPQGGPISVLISNVYLHYALDLWIEKVVKPQLKGEVYYLRYLDDFVLCFQYHEDAKRVYSTLPKRLGKFGLTLEPDKTKLVRFGRFAREKVQTGMKPETIYFLGFTFYCTLSRKGSFKLGITTEKSRRNRCKHKIKDRLFKVRYLSVPAQHKQIKLMLNGMFRYYGVGENSRATGSLYEYTRVAWRKSLSRRSQKGRYLWSRYDKTLKYFPLPRPKVYLSYERISTIALL